MIETVIPFYTRFPVTFTIYILRVASPIRLIDLSIISFIQYQTSSSPSLHDRTV